MIFGGIVDIRDLAVCAEGGKCTDSEHDRGIPFESRHVKEIYALRIVGHSSKTKIIPDTTGPTLSGAQNAAIVSDERMECFSER